MGSDGLPHSRSALIALTTVVQPMKDMAERSFDCCWIAIGHGDTQLGAQFGRLVPSGGDGKSTRLMCLGLKTLLPGCARSSCFIV